jgi:hypothetical protein
VIHTRLLILYSLGDALGIIRLCARLRSVAPACAHHHLDVDELRVARLIRGTNEMRGLRSYGCSDPFARTAA